MNRVNINYNGIELEVEYSIAPAEGDGFNDQHIPEHIEEIGEVLFHKHDAYLLVEHDIEKIKELVNEAIS